MNLTHLMRRTLRAFGYGLPGKTVKPKNPRRVEGGKRAAETRRLNKELAKVNAGATVTAVTQAEAIHIASTGYAP